MEGPTKAQIEELFNVHTGPEAQAERALRADAFDPRRRWARKDGYYRLSDRLWQGGKDVRRQINEVLQQAIRDGEDALDVAEKLEQYLDPSLLPVKMENGRFVRNQKKSILTEAPGRGGQGSFSARRLARTELTRAHGVATIQTARLTPFSLGVRWSLSASSHVKPDECSENATRDAYDLGPGGYPVDSVPRYPAHPMCRCVLSVITDDDVDAVVDQLRILYDL